MKKEGWNEYSREFFDELDDRITKSRKGPASQSRSGQRSYVSGANRSGGSAGNRAHTGGKDKIKIGREDMSVWSELGLDPVNNKAHREALLAERRATLKSSKRK